MHYMYLLVILLMINKEYEAVPTPLRLPGQTKKLTPFIKHWEPANFDRDYLYAAHEKHIIQKHQRRKRELNQGEYAPFHTIRLNFNAHDREFRLVLKQNPLSVFAGDVEIESTSGPIEYDTSRVYSGTLEDDENSYVHAILTNDNLLDGTIETKSEHYYLEPAHRYSTQLANSGIHSIVYKVSDIRLEKSELAATTKTHCASEKLRQKLQNDSQTKHDNKMLKKVRQKRWLPEDLTDISDSQQNPPLPLDLEIPYNDAPNLFAPTTTETKDLNDQSTEERTNHEQNQTFRNSLPPTRTNRNRNIIVNQYNPGNTDNADPSNNVPRLYTKHKNIIISTQTFNRSAINVLQDPYNLTTTTKTTSSSSNNNNQQNENNFSNANWTSMFINNNNARPIHKTHVEIITKNGATKKPNLIVNSYNPELTSNSINTNLNNMVLNNWFSGRGLDFDYANSHTQTGTGTGRTSYDRKITCMLYLQADHTFFQKMGSDEASIEAITRHVQRANSIYRNTDFNNDGKPDNITFMIKRIKVHNMNAVKDPLYRFPGNYGVEKFLELFSEEDYDAFCLAYMFTYRDFEMGTLGLAWTGDLKNAGGVCEKNGHYRGSLKSLNTGIVTLLNYGKHVPPAVSHVTLAHEIGHNFGSPHDPEQCTPGGEDGNYIMFARATSGDKKNNNKFSTCSLKSIEPVLNAKARSSKGCFTEPQTSICGNGVVEPGEQCDCGWEEDCKDACCFPMTRTPRAGEKPCTLTSQAMCSPSQGFCCTSDCKLKFGDKCRDDNGCRDPSFCDGRMPQCPPSVNKPNKTICNKEFVCYMGECTGSICLAYGLESCQCLPAPNEDKIKSCELCCKIPGEGNPCRSSFDWNELPYDVPDMYAKPGTPCNDYNGYCDVFQKCREVDPSGPLATLRKILLSEESIATFKKWVQHNWYTVALSALALVALLIISTKLLAKRSNSKLKSVTIIHSATTETVRLPDDKNAVIVHTAVRTKVPFKKKVRGERSRTTATTTNGTATATAAKANNIHNNNNINNNKKGNKSRNISNKSHKVASLAAKVYTQNNTKAKTTQTVLAESSKKQRSRRKTSAAETKTQDLATTNQNTTQQQQQQQQQQTNNTINDNELQKTTQVNAKKTRETTTINYTNRSSGSSGGRVPMEQTTTHINTLGRVQKWLLESPIVAQPLSHIEHSKVRNAMRKSQSTPERLVHNGPIKSKSTGYVPNEKVKLEVVYKPPFKFALRLSKKPAVKTHVVGAGGSAAAGALSRRKRLMKTEQRNNVTHASNVNQHLKEATRYGRDRDRNKIPSNAAVLLQTQKSEEPQTIDEPNYETLNRKSELRSSGGKHNSATALADYANIDIAKELQQQLQFADKFTADDGAVNLTRNFSSTQNLINNNNSYSSNATNQHSHLNKSSKKRSSLNLKTGSASKDVRNAFLQKSAKRSSSNSNLRRLSSDANATNSSNAALKPTTSSTAKHQNQHQHQHQQQLPSYNILRSSSSSHFNNIPRVSLSNQSTASKNSTKDGSINGSGNGSGNRRSLPGHGAPTSHPNEQQQRGFFELESVGRLPTTTTTTTTSATPTARTKTTPASLAARSQQHRPNLFPQLSMPEAYQQNKFDSGELPSDLEVAISDVENLLNEKTTTAA